MEISTRSERPKSRKVEWGEEELAAVAGMEDGRDEQRESDDSPEREASRIAERVEVLGHFPASETAREE